MLRATDPLAARRGRPGLEISKSSKTTIIPHPRRTIQLLYIGIRRITL